jgi:hypothetical protein
VKIPDAVVLLKEADTGPPYEYISETTEQFYAIVALLVFVE